MSDDDEGSCVDELTQRRIARNEARFRDMNDQQLVAGEDFQGKPAAGVLSIMCECADTACDQMVEVPIGTYREVRSHRTWFVVLPDHLAPAIERLERDCGTYWIVAKMGVGAEVVRDES